MYAPGVENRVLDVFFSISLAPLQLLDYMYRLARLTLVSRSFPLPFSLFVAPLFKWEGLGLDLTEVPSPSISMATHVTECIRFLTD